MGIELDSSSALALVSRVSELGIEGKAPRMKTSAELAEAYLRDSRYRNHDARIDSLIRWESSKTFATGFATGVGGVLVSSRKPTFLLISISARPEIRETACLLARHPES